MENFGIRPPDNYIFEAEWQELFVLTEHWKSDILFYRDDLKFLQHLIDRYFKWLSKTESIDRVVQIEEELLTLENQGSVLLKGIQKHLLHLSDLMRDPFTHDSHRFREEHQQLENNISRFVKEFRVQKKKVFEITEYLLDSREIKKRMLG